jgi:hypothetical protein
LMGQLSEQLYQIGKEKMIIGLWIDVFNIVFY